jgi:serine/threonine protein kinase
MGKTWQKRLLLSLGSAFLQSYVSLISSGALEPHHVLTDTCELTLGKTLGTGASGTVFLAAFRGQDVAVKSISDTSLSFNLREFLSELALMNIVRHKNVVQLIFASRTSGNYLLASKV